MTEASHEGRESIRKEIGKSENQLKVLARPLPEEEKPSIEDYKSENRGKLANRKTDYTKVTSKPEEKIQEKYKTPEQVLDEDYNVAPTSTDRQKVKSDNETLR